jgi:hypothetical protein
MIREVLRTSAASVACSQGDGKGMTAITLRFVRFDAAVSRIEARHTCHIMGYPLPIATFSSGVLDLQVACEKSKE